jgi:hypothetical protein
MLCVKFLTKFVFDSTSGIEKKVSKKGLLTNASPCLFLCDFLFKIYESASSFVILSCLLTGSVFVQF